MGILSCKVLVVFRDSVIPVVCIYGENFFCGAFFREIIVFLVVKRLCKHYCCCVWLAVYVVHGVLCSRLGCAGAKTCKVKFY